MATGRAVTDALSALPAERVIEVHVAGGDVEEGAGGPIYVDAHDRSVREETWAMLDRMLPALPNLKALCFECEGVAEDAVLATLARLRGVIAERSASPVFRTSVAASAAASAAASVTARA